MTTTQTTQEKDTDKASAEQCDNDWCDGPESETLPCFSCYDLNREYQSGVPETEWWETL